jgi:hypothetical protein
MTPGATQLAAVRPVGDRPSVLSVCQFALGLKSTLSVVELFDIKRPIYGIN